MDRQTANEDCPMPDRSQDDRVREILSQSRAVVVVGMSPKPERPSHQVGLYLRDHGYTVFPVHPAAKEIEGLKVYPSLDAIPENENIDIVTLFISGDRVMELVEPCAGTGAKVVYFQPGAENPEAEEKARQMGLEVFSGRCIMADHKRLMRS